MAPHRVRSPGPQIVGQLGSAAGFVWDKWQVQKNTTGGGVRSSIAATSLGYS